MTNHKHLRNVIEDIYANQNQLTEELTFRLINEFRYSNLYIPAKRANGTLNFIIYEDEDGKITPLFTDPDEFHKFFKDEDDIQIIQNSFELYQNILKTSKIEGYILNPSSEKYLFKKEFILSITHIPKTNFYSSDPYTKEELKDLKDSLNNSSLEEFIKNPNNIGNYEELFELMADATFLTLMLSDLNLKPENGIVDMQEIGPQASMHLDRIGGEYATIFTSEEKMLPINTEKHKYSQIVNLATLVNFVLTEDLDGIVLNPETDNVLITRMTLLKYSLGFERFANNEKLSMPIFYMFPIDI